MRAPGGELSREQRVAKIVRDLGISTMTFIPQRLLDDWGDSGVITAANLPAINEDAIRISRTFTYLHTPERVSEKAERDKSSLISESISSLSRESLDSIRRSGPVLWDAVSTSWPIDEPSSALLGEILQSRIQNLDLNTDISGGSSEEPHLRPVTLGQMKIDGVLTSCAQLQDNESWFGACAALSGDRVVTVVLPKWAAAEVTVELVTSSVLSRSLGS